MATREERLLMRLRGAGRHEVEDVSFGIVFPEAEDEEASANTEASITVPESPVAITTVAAAAAVVSPVPAPRLTNPNTSAKRRRIDAPESNAESGRISAFDAPPSPQRLPGRSTFSRQDPYEMPDRTPEHAQLGGIAATTPTETAEESRRDESPGNGDNEDGDELESLPRPTPPTGAALGRSRASPAQVIEVVTESPVDAPGSGRRQRILAAPRSSTALQKVAMQQQSPQEEEGDEITLDMSEFPAGLGVTSSPLVRRAERRMSEISRPSVAGRRSARTSGASAGSTGADDLDELSLDVGSRRSPRLSKTSTRDGSDELDVLSPTTRRRSPILSRTSVQEEIDELSPERPMESVASAPAKEKTSTKSPKGKKPVAQPPVKLPSKSPPRSTRQRKPKETQKPQPEPEPSPVQELEETDEPEEAQEIDATEAARTLGLKRPRRSMAASESPEPEDDEPEEGGEPAAKRRRRKAPPQSPATQQRPKTRKEKKQAAEKTKRPTTKKKSKAVADNDNDDDELQGGTVPVTVQRFTVKKVRLENAPEDDEADVLASKSAIPFANRVGVNAVDVLAQMCDELVDGFLSNLTEKGRAAEDAAARREFRTMIRALEEFREELRTRLLEHTIALDTLHALQKRVRTAQKQKLALRQEILEIRAEREQVGLKMDAVRIKHEEESKEALDKINLSSTMHDIDLAVEKGLAAPPLTAAEKGKAERANLEYLISKVMEQACTKSHSGGALKQIKDFNAFLERAATALEGR